MSIWVFNIKPQDLYKHIGERLIFHNGFGYIVSGILEKADKEFSSTMKKQMRDFIRTLCELERLLYNKDFIDERVLNNEILEWRKFRMNITERYL